MIRVERGKEGAIEISLSARLCWRPLREYWRGKKPRIYLFPSSAHTPPPPFALLLFLFCIVVVVVVVVVVG
jgi:hypothetical protein